MYLKFSENKRFRSGWTDLITLWEFVFLQLLRVGFFHFSFRGSRKVCHYSLNLCLYDINDIDHNFLVFKLFYWKMGVRRTGRTKVVNNFSWVFFPRTAGFLFTLSLWFILNSWGKGRVSYFNSSFTICWKDYSLSVKMLVVSWESADLICIDSVLFH